MSYCTVNIGSGSHPAQQLMHHDAVCSSAGFGKLHLVEREGAARPQPQGTSKTGDKILFQYHGILLPGNRCCWQVTVIKMPDCIILLPGKIIRQPLKSFVEQA